MEYTDALGYKETYKYDAYRNMVSKYDKKKTTYRNKKSERTYEYCPIGKIKESNGDVTVTRAYNEKGLVLIENRYDSSGNRVRLDVTGSETYSTSYVYDKNKRLQKEETSKNGEIKAYDYQYDRNVNQTLKTESIIKENEEGSADFNIYEESELDKYEYEKREYDLFNQLITEKHPFYVVGKGWVYAQNLAVGDKLKQSDNNTVEVLEVTVKELVIPIKVYNFEVEDWHTYFVSDLNILVHNDCGRMHISNSQLGKKWGEHKLDYLELNSHQEYKSKAQSIFQNPDSIIPDHNKGKIYFIKGNDLLRIKENGDFVSLYPAANTQRVKDALKNLNK